MVRICSPQLGISPNSFLGGEVYDFQIIDHLAQNGIICEVLLPKNRQYQQRPNLNVEFLPITSIFPPHLFNFLALPYIIRKYKQTHFDILRIHSPYFLGLTALFFKKIYPNTKIVTQILLDETGLDKEYILRKSIHIYDHIFVLTDFLKQGIIEKYKVDPKKITTVYGGIEENLGPTKKDLTLLNKLNLKDKIVLLNIGQMIPRKNLVFLLEVYKKLKTTHPNTALILCGAGWQKEQLIEVVKQEKIIDAHILDPVFGVEKNKLFNLADIFMFPTKSEGFGLVAAEAMACGKPVVVSNNTSLPEVVSDNVTGYLVQTDNLDRWVSKTSKLIENPALIKKMGLRALNESKKFTWEEVAKIHINVFRKLVNE